MNSETSLQADLENHIAILDQKIRLGDLKFLQNELDGLELELIPRSYALAIARLARRSSRSLLAAKILHPIVRPIDSSSIKPTGAEIAEYAAVLTYLGASQEALGLLKKVNSEQFPESFLFQAFALFSRWEYKLAIPPLRNYIGSSKIGEYDLLVGKLNLAAALIFVKQYDESKKLLDDVISQASSEKNYLVWGNALERLAEIAINQKLWRTADKLLIEAEGLIKDRTHLFNLFIRKWRLFLQILSAGYKDEYRKKLSDLREEASVLNHWETIRHCDRFEAVTTQNKKLFLQVYFGTPFRDFRDSLVEEYKSNVYLPEYFVWGPEATEIDMSAMSLDVESGDLTQRDSNGMISKIGKPLVPDSLSHKLLMVLASDFYAAFGIRYLFACLFPDKNYSPKSSDFEVLDVIEEFRRWLNYNGIPIKVEERGGFFKLKFLGSVTLKVYR